MSEDSEEIFKTLFERLYNLPPDRPDRQFRPRRKKNTGNMINLGHYLFIF